MFVQVMEGSPSDPAALLARFERWKSSFIHDAGDDARDLTDHLARYLEGQAGLQGAAG